VEQLEQEIEQLLKKKPKEKHSKTVNIMEQEEGDEEDEIIVAPRL